MKILALSTSSKILSIVVCKEDKILSKFHEDISNEHSSNIIDKVQETLSLANMDISDIDLFCVDIGPGSFTGLRVGVTAIKITAKVLQKPVVGIKSLDILADAINCEGMKKCVILDAKRKKVYSGIYKENEHIGSYQLSNIKDVLKNIKDDVIFSGDAISLYKPEILEELSGINVKFVSEDRWYPQAVNLAKLGLYKYNKTGSDDVDKLVPEYFYSKECSIKGI